jgi:hypothetical protein
MANQENKNNFNKKGKTKSGKSSSIKINGIKIEDMNVRYLIKNINLFTVITVGALVVSLPILFIMILKGDFKIEIALPSAVVLLLPVALNFKRIKAMKSELKKRDLTEEEKAFYSKNLKRTVIAYIAIGISMLLLVFWGLESTDSNGFGGSSSSSGVSGEPWKDLGVSKSEYMKTYNYIADHS